MTVVTTIGIAMLPCEGIPCLHCVIPTPGSDIFAIWRPCNGFYDISVRSILVDKMSTFSIPYQNSLVTASGGDVFVIRGPRDGKYKICVIAIRNGFTYTY